MSQYHPSTMQRGLHDVRCCPTDFPPVHKEAVKVRRTGHVVLPVHGFPDPTVPVPVLGEGLLEPVSGRDTSCSDALAEEEVRRLLHGIGLLYGAEVLREAREQSWTEVPLLVLLH